MHRTQAGPERDIHAERIKANRVMLGPPGGVVDVPIADLQPVLILRPVAGLASIREEDVGADPEALAALVLDAEKEWSAIRAA